MCTVGTGCVGCRAWHLKFRKQVLQEEVGLHNDDDLPTIDIMIPWKVIVQCLLCSVLTVIDVTYTDTSDRHHPQFEAQNLYSISAVH
jgi:hypothetical protein